MSPDNLAAINEIERRRYELLHILESLELKPGMQHVTQTAARAINAGVDLVAKQLERS